MGRYIFCASRDEHPFIVAKLTNKGILEMDFLRAYRSSINLARNKICWSPAATSPCSSPWFLHVLQFLLEPPLAAHSYQLVLGATWS